MARTKRTRTLSFDDNISLEEARTIIHRKDDFSKTGVNTAKRVIKQECKSADNMLSNVGRKPSYAGLRGDDPIIASKLVIPDKEVEPVTEEYVMTLMSPKTPSKLITEVTGLINSAIFNSGAEPSVMKDLIGQNMDVLAQVKTTNIHKYLDACKFVYHYNRSNDLVSSYALVFPEKIQEFEAKQITLNTLRTYASAYAGSKLVTLIRANVLVPPHILYQSNFHQAIMVQTRLMNDETISPKVRSDAANSLITHLKPPESKEQQLNIGINGGVSINNLMETITNLAQTQKDKLDQGAMSIKDISELKFVSVEDAEYEEL